MGIQAGKMPVPCATAASPMPATPVATDPDTDDVHAACAGDRMAFQRLYRRHVDRVHGAMYRLAGYDRARAEDLTQDAFIRAWQKLSQFRHQSTFGTWLYRLAINLALMALRAQRADPVGGLDADALPEPGATPFCAAERAELQRAIGRLPARARAVLVLHDIEGWHHEEIGAALAIATGTSKAQLHRARALLRVALGDPT